ncbi:hypothetical protein ERIC2_c34680 [Paenibacillus larvae subsp. larvae DSM 25430]|uniref:Uncharacterized protein n=1 Tax=Paenibacillus larvae subsp. larvae DSM 25430 TaxID=697284 RepID=V9WAI9_9BACL|nr:hypothetical protein ERIC2_c34680 [Paenibacillus larvae subsp. larvae DSM 25430]
MSHFITPRIFRILCPNIILTEGYEYGSFHFLEPSFLHNYTDSTHILNMTNMCHQLFLINYFYLGLDNRQGGTPMETFQALKLMFLFGMFILALLTFIQKMK